jgi:tripartite-type tricarboxylate transporter receptor subunit TctC
VGGQVQMSFSNTALMQPLIREGKLRALGVTSATRRPELPDVPAIAETVPGYEVTSFFGIVAPAGTPQGVVDRLNAILNAGMKAGDMREAMLKLNWALAPSTPPEFAAFIAGEAQKWRDTAQTAGIRID